MDDLLILARLRLEVAARVTSVTGKQLRRSRKRLDCSRALLAEPVLKAQTVPAYAIEGDDESSQ